ncbi:Peroxisomal fatty acid beta-oxidation multifunctional protein [Rhynchospora pubera]|uniref:Peroxisomal fatty acid beta-oxidation multifunctional protein n=1 Tax=Rhynchospora pubera TaxID=906938 RepID=A0AAV8EV46_9POAL|nr:Peroxisomal fatty acid beta-oxidation multifunctional protein [Rhynchospora pubera]
MGKTEMAVLVGEDGFAVALITIVNPPVNALSFDVLISLATHYEEALTRDDVKAIVLTGSNGRFCGGFDINAFQSPTSAKEKLKVTPNEFLTYYVEGGKKPTVAAIDGLALGGGLELAMACHGRLSTSYAQLGLPELQLGIIPGMGGTQRLPRLVGLPKSLEMMILSKSIRGKEAHSLGLIDAIASPADLISAARLWALQIADHKRPWAKTIYRTDKIPSSKEAREILNFARAQARKQAPNVMHPLVCIDVIEEGIISGPQAGLMKEVKCAKELQASQTSKSLIHVFFAQRATSKVPGITNIGLLPRKIKKVAIVGGGLMGSGIATALISNNILVILKEINEKFLQAGIDRVRENLENRVKKGHMTQDGMEKALRLLIGVLGYEQFSDVNMVIEAIIEDASLKQQIFCDLEKYCNSDCILATNTSTIDLHLIGQKTASQDRIAGAHFFSPAQVMPLLEIVRTPNTSPQVVVDLLDLAKKIRKTPVVVNNCTGFAVNRMFFPYTQAAILLVDHGVDLYRIDLAITEFGMPMGPFRLIDLVGFGVAAATGAQYLQSFPERCYKSTLIPSMLQDKQTGEASCMGFYIYDDKRQASANPEVSKYVEKSRRLSGFTPDSMIAGLRDKDIVEMLFFPVVNEACRVLDEGISVKSSDLDIASIMGMGFPSYRGGILFWADTMGANYVYSRLMTWCELYGEFFKPCNYLAERAIRGFSLGAQIDRARSQL